MLGPTPRVVKYQDLRQKHQSAISEARMRSRLAMAISVGKLRLIEWGQIAEEEQTRHDHIPALFYRRAVVTGDATPAPRNISTTTNQKNRSPKVSRFNAKVRCNYYPLPLREAERIRNLLRFPIELFSALDPCVGDGAAFAAITRDSSARRYGIELDAYRAEQAGPSLTKIVQGNCLETHCAVESFSLCFCNPPYDWALAGNARERLEAVFLNHIFRWLIPGGVLLLVIPAERATDCAQILASHFKRARVFRLSHPESVRYRQVLIAGVRRTRREREQLRDREISEGRYRFTTLGREYESLPELADSCDDPYAVPTSGPAALTFKGLPLDELEDLVANSPAYRQTTRILAPEPTVIGGRPLTPLHAGQVGLVACSGLINGIFGSGEERHIAAWKSKKVTTKLTEEEEDGTTVIRERERFVQELSVVFATGETGTLE